MKYKLISIRRKLNRKLHSKCTPIFNRDKMDQSNIWTFRNLWTHEVDYFMNLPYESDICDDFLLLKCRSQYEDSPSSNSLKNQIVLEWNGKKKILQFILSPYATCWGWKRTWNTILKMINCQKIYFLTGLMYAQQLPVTTEPTPLHASGSYEIDL